MLRGKTYLLSFSMTISPALQSGAPPQHTGQVPSGLPLPTEILGAEMRMPPRNIGWPMLCG